MTCPAVPLFPHCPRAALPGMANPEYIELLKQGVAAWNQFQEKNGNPHPDLTCAELTRLDLRGAMLNGADLTQAKLSGSDLTECALVYTNLFQAVFSRDAEGR